MPDIVGFGDKVLRLGHLNRDQSHNAPTTKSELAQWLGIPKNRLSKSYGREEATIRRSLERAIVMSLGFGPADAELERHGEGAWVGWLRDWGQLWRRGRADELVQKLEETGYFVERAPDDPRLLELLPKIGGARATRSGVAPPAPVLSTVVVPADAVPVPRTFRDRYLDRLASFRVLAFLDGTESARLVASFAFGKPDVQTDEGTYFVAINRCRAELFLEDSFEPVLEERTVDSRSRPHRALKIKREVSSANHPSWILVDEQPRTALYGEYPPVDLGVAPGKIEARDEAGLLVSSGGFAVWGPDGKRLEEGGILTNLLRFLIANHVGQIASSGGHYYRLSVGPITARYDDD